MKNSKTVGCCGLLAVVLAGVLLTGCGSAQPRPWNVSITKTTSASIQVDLIGVNAAEEPIWQGYNIDKYWSEGDLRRKDAQPMTQVLKKGQPWVISLKDAKWQAWLNRGATELLVIANLPGHFEPGSGDPRRLFLPLNKGAWNAKNDTLEIEVQDTMILVLTPRAK